MLERGREESERMTPRGNYLRYAPCWWHWCEDVADVIGVALRCQLALRGQLSSAGHWMLTVHPYLLVSLH